MKKMGDENVRAESERTRRLRQNDNAVIFQGEVAYLEESSGDEGLLVVDDILDGIAALIPLPSYSSPDQVTSPPPPCSK